MVKPAKHFIAGGRHANGHALLISRQASDGQETGYTFLAATPQDVEAAASAATHAFIRYAQTTAEQRARFLDSIADEVALLGDDFLTIVHQESALPLVRLQGELARTCGQLRLFASLLRRGDSTQVRIDTAQPARTPVPRPDLRQYRTALGPVAIFGASNFPLAFSTAGGDTAAALAAGCSVVVKAHEAHMATAAYTAAAIERAVQKTNMPAGVFNMIFGTDIGALLVQHPAIMAAGFTGSLRGGRALFDLACRRPRPIPVFAEMSSINPLVILPGALQTQYETLVSDLLASFTLGCGQFCTKPGLILLLHTDLTDRFCHSLRQKVVKCAAQPMLSTTILQHYHNAVSALHTYPEIQLLACGKNASEHQAQARVYQAPAALLSEAHSILHEEIFGPLAIVVECADVQQLTAILQQLPGQLTATIHADTSSVDNCDSTLAQSLLPLLAEKAGRVLFNGYPTGVEVCDAMVHGGPYPATTDARATSVGTLAIERFLRPVCLQNVPAALLPPALQNSNPLNLLRLINGVWTRDAIA